MGVHTWKSKRRAIPHRELWDIDTLAEVFTHKLPVLWLIFIHQWWPLSPVIHAFSLVLYPLKISWGRGLEFHTSTFGINIGSKHALFCGCVALDIFNGETIYTNSHQMFSHMKNSCLMEQALELPHSSNSLYDLSGQFIMCWFIYEGK